MKNFAQKNNGAAAADGCTESAIAEAVRERGRVELGVEAFRARLRECMDLEVPTIVKKFDRPCAVLVPLKVRWWWDRKERLRVIRKAKKLVLAELCRLRDSL